MGKLFGLSHVINFQKTLLSGNLMLAYSQCHLLSITEVNQLTRMTLLPTLLGLSVISVCVIYLDKVVDSFKVGQVVVRHVHTNTEVKTSITPVDDLEVPEL